MALTAENASAVMAQIEAKEGFFQRALGIRAGRSSEACRCIQYMKHGPKMTAMQRRAIVLPDLMLFVSTLMILSLE